MQKENDGSYIAASEVRRLMDLARKDERAQVREETLKEVREARKENTRLGFHNWLMIKLKEVGKE